MLIFYASCVRCGDIVLLPKLRTKTKLILLSVSMIVISFLPIGLVVCNELFTNACIRIHPQEDIYTALPYFLAVFVTGLIIFLATRKSKKID